MGLDGNLVRDRRRPQRCWPRTPSKRLAALAVLLACSAVTRQSTGEELDGPTLRQRSADLLSRAIRIPTTQPPLVPGGEAQLAALWVAELGQAGIEARVIETPSKAGPADRRAAAWGRIPGTGAGGGAVLLLSHLDVVPANADEWNTDPWSGRIREGQVLGRGALDAKGVAVVHLETLVELSRRERPLARDVIFLSTPDEENGGRAGAGYLTRERPELFAGVEFVLTEGGGVRIGGRGRPPLWGISITEKSPCWLELSTRGRAGHSSAPARDAAVPRLVAALDKVRRIETPVRVLPEVERMFRLSAPLAPEEDRAAYRDLARQLEEDPDFRRRFLANPALAALVRNTVSITVLEGAARINVAPAVARAQLDVRLLPGERCQDFRAALVEIIADPQVKVDVVLSFPSRSSSTDSALFRAIATVAEESQPGALVVPRIIGGFTDAHWFRELGITAYGFVPRWLAADDTRGIHGPDEHISIDNLERGVRTLVRILEEL